MLINRCLISIETIDFVTCAAYGSLRGGIVITIQLAFGKRLQELRKERGLSQEKFALAIGMDRTYYASVEAGKRNVSLRNIQKISQGFGINLSQLFYGVE